MGAALEAEGRASRARPADDLRDARPDRGADLRRQGRRDEGRQGRADRHAGANCSSGPSTLSSAISSARPGMNLLPAAGRRASRAMVDGSEICNSAQPTRTCRTSARFRSASGPITPIARAAGGVPCRCAASTISAASGWRTSRSGAQQMVATVPHDMSIDRRQAGRVRSGASTHRLRRRRARRRGSAA